jgi:hypothetical protein
MSTANEAMQAVSENKSPGARDKAKNLLLALLAGGDEVLADDIEDAAKARDTSMKTMRRAADDIKKDGLGEVVIYKDRTTPKGKWFWKLSKEK